MKKGQSVLVTTEFRGVFFGEAEEYSKLPEEITLKNVRNCISWSSDCKGFLGLAKHGPTKNCSIGMEHDKITLYRISSHAPVTEEAKKRWKSA